MHLLVALLLGAPTLLRQLAPLVGHQMIAFCKGKVVQRDATDIQAKAVSRRSRVLRGSIFVDDHYIQLTLTMSCHGSSAELLSFSSGFISELPNSVLRPRLSRR